MSDVIGHVEETTGRRGAKRGPFTRYVSFGRNRPQANADTHQQSQCRGLRGDDHGGPPGGPSGSFGQQEFGGGTQGMPSGPGGSYGQSGSGGPPSSGGEIPGGGMPPGAVPTPDGPGSSGGSSGGSGGSSGSGSGSGGNDSSS